MKLNLNDTVKVVVNSLVEGVMDKNTAISTIEGCISEKFILNTECEFPLDSISAEKAIELYENKGVTLHCEDGHVLAIYRERKTRFMGVINDDEGKKCACL